MHINVQTSNESPLAVHKRVQYTAISRIRIGWVLISGLDQQDSITIVNIESCWSQGLCCWVSELSAPVMNRRTAWQRREETDAMSGIVVVAQQSKC